MVYKKIPINDLTPASYNPRKKLKPSDPEFQKIKRSIEEFGFVDPIIVNSDMTIIGGHQRWYVLKSLGHNEVDCVVVEVDKTKEKALNIALNKITGAWDNEKLAAALRDLQSLDYDTGLTGFDPPEIDELFNSLHTKETKEDDCNIPLPEKTISQLGDVWQLGRHRLMCGDATDPAVVKKLMEGKKANVVVIDPPACGKTDPAVFVKTLNKAFRNIADAMANDSSIYVFHTDADGLLLRRAWGASGLYLSGVCVWAKSKAAEGTTHYQQKHEPVLFGWKKMHKWFADRKQSTVWNFDRQTKSEQYPDMKPVALCAYPMLNSSMANGIALDVFGGTGTTLIAAEQIGRVCYMADIDPRYVDLTVLRYIAQVGGDTDVWLIRDGKRMNYKQTAKSAGG